MSSEVLPDPGDAAYEVVRSVMVSKLRETGYNEMAECLLDAQLMYVPTWLALGLMAQASTRPTTPASTDPDLCERVARALTEQMECQADDTTPSSIQRNKGMVWLEGWFDIPAAIKQESDNGH